MNPVYHPRPYKYESLANYINRLSKLNFCPSEWIMRELEIQSLKGYEKVNCYTKKETFDYLQNHWTDISFEEAKGMVAEQFNKRLWNPSKLNSRNAAGRDISDYIDNKSTKYCPICLKQIPYHRIYWQIKHINICLEHDVVLNNKCEKCGNSINVESVVNGFCSCGHCLIDSVAERITDNCIIENQINLYKSYEIDTYREFYEDSYVSTYRLNLKKQNFLYLYSYLYKKIYDNLSDCNKLKQHYHNDKLVNYSKELVVTGYIDSIIKNWPEGFICFLDDMYYTIEIKYQNNYSKYVDYIQKPSLTIKELKEEINDINDFFFINQLIDDYFESLDTIDNYKYRLRYELIKNDFVESYVVSNIIGLNGSADSKNKLFKTFTGDEAGKSLGLDYPIYDGLTQLVRIEDIVNFIIKIRNIKSRSSYNDGKSISLQALENIFINFDIDYADIFQCIFEGNLHMYLGNSEICNTKNIFVNKEEAYMLFLEKSLQKIREKHDLKTFSSLL